MYFCLTLKLRFAPFSLGIFFVFLIIPASLPYFLYLKHLGPNHSLACLIFASRTCSQAFHSYYLSTLQYFTSFCQGTALNHNMEMQNCSPVLSSCRVYGNVKTKKKMTIAITIKHCKACTCNSDISC